MFWLWFFRLFFTALSFGAAANMFKQLAQPFSPHTVVKADGRRVRQGTLDNMLDGAASVWGFCMIISLAGLLWLA